MTRTRQTLALAAVFALALSGILSLHPARAGGGGAAAAANAASKCNLVVQGQHFRLPCRG